MRGSSHEDVDRAVQAAKKAQVEWGNLTGFERGQILSKAGRLIKVSYRVCLFIISVVTFN